MKKKLLNGTWKLFYCDQLQKNIDTPDGLPSLGSPLECTVPSNVELELSKAGILPEDLYFGSNIRLCEKFETYQWWYEKEFELTDEELDSDLYLTFDGVDCLATYFLNGIKIGESRNMLISHEFCINAAKQKNNILHVKISSSILENHTEKFSAFSMFVNPFVTMKPMNLRKAPHSYSWDIFPRAVSAGIWRSVYISAKPEIEFSQLAYYCFAPKYGSIKVSFVYEIMCPYELIGKSVVIISGKCRDSEFEVSGKLKFHAGKLTADIKNPHLWWPKGYGAPDLYDVSVKLVSNGEVMAYENITIGLRTVELQNSGVTDGEEGNFAFVVNGEEIFCKGTNWVPLDAFHSRDAERYSQALKLLDDVGCNMVRMWGGNVYEEHEFFDFCDTHGIMVWQDFTMACAAYPQTESFANELKSEAEFIVKKLRNHPSIVLWSGDNECDATILQQIGWFDPNNNILTRKILKDVVDNHDFATPYLPSSPYFSQRVYEMKTDTALAENHLWGPRDYYKSRFYSESNAHFISEIGYHACNCIESLEKFLPKEDIYPAAITDNHILHSTDWEGDDSRVRLVSDQIIQLFGAIPETMEDFVIASQISQAEALKYFVERMRINRPRKKGILWWNLLDGWPQISDAVVDYYFQKKLAYKWLKNIQQPLCIMIDEIEDWNLKIVVGNDSLSAKSGIVTVTDYDSGEVLFESAFQTEKNSSKVLGEIRTMYSEQKLLIIKWTADSMEYVNHYICGQVPLSLEKCKKWVSTLEKIYK